MPPNISRQVFVETGRQFDMQTTVRVIAFVVLLYSFSMQEPSDDDGDYRVVAEPKSLLWGCISTGDQLRVSTSKDKCPVNRLKVRLMSVLKPDQNARSIP